MMFRTASLLVSTAIVASLTTYGAQASAQGQANVGATPAATATAPTTDPETPPNAAQIGTPANPGSPVEAEPTPLTTDAQQADTATTGDIVVTGSRLATGFSAPTPVTVLGEGKLETRAPSSIAEVVNEIPAFRQSSGQTQSQRFSAGSGQNNLDLRGLGVTRTLLLIDGRRQATTDTNVIPVGLVDRVEVVTGGASAAYGSDAVAGVVNFILKKKIEGIEATVQSGISEQGDNSEQLVSLAAGGTLLDGRLRITAGGDYLHSGGVGTIYTRDFGQPGLVSFGSAAMRGSLPAQGFLPNVSYSGQTADGVITSGPLRNTAFGPGGVTFAFQQGTVYSNVMNGGQNYGQNPSGNYPLKTPIERVSGLARAEFDVSNGLTIFAEGAYSDVKGSGFTSFFQAPSISVSINNPYLPAATRAAAIAAGVNGTTGTVSVGRTFTELGGYQLPTDRQTARAAIGANGTIFGNWKWDAYYQYSKSRNVTRNSTDVLAANFYQAINAVRDASGNIVCGSVASNPNLNAALRSQLARFQSLNNATCAPINIFGLNSPSAASLAYVTGAGLENKVVLNDTLHVVAGNLSGSPFDTWAGPVSIALGGEYRSEKLTSVADALSQTQTWASTNGATYSGDLNVKEGYVEIGVPLASESRFAKSLDLNGAARYTDYSTSGSVTTWKVGLTYEPADMLRFRVTRSRDIRAPNLTELFQTGATVPIANILNPLNNQSGTLNTIVAGNADLQAEKADTLTGGVVFTPTWEWARGFKASVDYYSIKVDGVISSLTTPEILRRCAAGDQAFCSSVNFDGSTFGIASVLLQPFNLNQLKTTGLDIEVSYRAPVDSFGVPGSFNVRGLATHVFSLKTIDATGTIDRAGSLQQNGVPAWTANVDLTYELGGFSSTLGTRFFSASRYDATLIGPESAAYNPALPNSINDNTLPSRTYFDLSLRYTVAETGSSKFQLFGIVSNLADKKPPFAAILINSGGNPYDLIGRTFKAGARFNF